MTTITINRATVEQALEAMKRGVPTGKITLYEWDKAMAALRAALAQQAEPVQEQHERELTEVLAERDEAEDYIDALLDEVLGPDRAEWSSAYDRADALEEVRERIDQMLKPSIDKAWNRFEAEPVEPVEPVAWAFRHSDGTYHDPSVTEHSAGMVPLYPPPPQRKPLTDEEIDALPWNGSPRQFARAVERALEEKNRGR